MRDCVWQAQALSMRTFEPADWRACSAMSLEWPSTPLAGKVPFGGSLERRPEADGAPPQSHFTAAAPSASGNGLLLPERVQLIKQALLEDYLDGPFARLAHNVRTDGAVVSKGFCLGIVIFV